MPFELSQSLGFTSPTKKVETKLFYSGVYTDGVDTPCELVELVSEKPKIVKIKVNDTFHNIEVEYLKEMQVTHRALERARNGK